MGPHLNPYGAVEGLTIIGELAGSLGGRVIRFAPPRIFLPSQFPLTETEQRAAGATHVAREVGGRCATLSEIASQSFSLTHGKGPRADEVRG